MSEAQAILYEMARRGVAVRVDGATLRLKPREAIDEALLTRVIQHKPEIIRALVQMTPTTPCGDGNSNSWSPESLDYERRFGQPHSRLFPFLGRKVRTPAGVGTLIQVFSERVTVLLDSDLDKCTYFPPAHISPVSDFSMEAR